MTSLIAPSKHSPIEDAEALQRAVKGDYAIFIFSFLLSTFIIVFYSIFKVILAFIHT
jgi:hypothetical protein